MPEFNLNIKPTGEIVISIKYKDKSDEISEQAMKAFLYSACSNSIELKPVGSYVEMGNPSASFEQYEIVIVNQPK